MNFSIVVWQETKREAKNLMDILRIIISIANSELNVNPECPQTHETGTQRENIVSELWELSGHLLPGDLSQFAGHSLKYFL